MPVMILHNFRRNFSWSWYAIQH